MITIENLTDEWKNLQWFENCGTEVNLGYDFDYKVVKFKEAMKRIESIKWENENIEGLNDFDELLCKNQNYHNDWNKNVDLYKKIIKPHIWDKIKEAGIKFDFTDSTYIDVNYNIMIIIIMRYYSNQTNNEVKSEYYEKLAQIYLSGHIPCGIKGTNKKGTIMVY